MGTTASDNAQNGAGVIEKIVLTFHGLGSVPDHVPEEERRFWVSPDLFKRFVQAAVAPPPGTTVQLTLDDGNASDRESALPILMAHGAHATFFVCAGRIGRAGYLDAAALRELTSAGMEVGSHGMDHVDWRRATGKVRMREFGEARRIIEDTIGRPVMKAAIPFGSYNGPVLAGLRQAGFRELYSSDGGIVRNEMFPYPRNTITAEDVPEQVLASLRDPGRVTGQAFARLKRIYKQFRIW